MEWKPVTSAKPVEKDALWLRVWQQWRQSGDLDALEKALHSLSVEQITRLRAFLLEMEDYQRTN